MEEDGDWWRGMSGADERSREREGDRVKDKEKRLVERFQLCECEEWLERRMKGEKDLLTRGTR